jgi:diguanylate cyclase (GGDEF)-like protein
LQKVPVIRYGNKDSVLTVLDSTQVLKIEKIREREYILHTHDDQYVLDVSFESIEEWLFEDGFRLIDSTNIVNMNKVTLYDEKNGIVYLGDPNHKQTKKASVARIQKEHVENVTALLKLAHDEYTDEAAAMEAWLEEFTEHDSNNRFLRSYATIRAITEREKAEAQIFHMAYHDKLTMLPNRQLFNDNLMRFFDTSKGEKAAVIFLDLDRFKIINDTLGHFVGDQLLKHIGEKLQSYVREEHTVARFGGDEFIILLTNISHIDEVTTYVKGILALLIEEPFIYETQELHITGSIGVSHYPDDGTDADTLIKNADIAMYQAKDKGGNTYKLYHSKLNHHSKERLNLEIDLRKALERNEILVYYQPQIDLSTGQIIGMESLARWKHPELGMIPPSTFIPLAEEIGMIVPIGNFILQQACQQIKTLDVDYPALTVAVNISFYQFQQAGFVKYIAQTLKQLNIQPHRLCLEITENVAMNNINHILNTMADLKKIGVQIAIDDFGTGYSSLGYLKNFKVNSLKIDQSFIRDITTDEDNAAIVTALIAMCRQLKIKSVAEGVETEQQLEFLKNKGCTEIQGYLFSKPIPHDEFETLLQSNRNLYPTDGETQPSV